MQIFPSLLRVSAYTIIYNLLSFELCVCLSFSGKTFAILCSGIFCCNVQKNIKLNCKKFEHKTKWCFFSGAAHVLLSKQRRFYGRKRVCRNVQIEQILHSDINFGDFTTSHSSKPTFLYDSGRLDIYTSYSGFSRSRTVIVYNCVGQYHLRFCFNISQQKAAKCLPRLSVFQGP